MTRFGYFLSTEELGPDALIERARMAQDAGFDALWISDHFHPWNAEQGESAFVWSMIGALSQVVDLPITTAVTCPMIRTHPAVIAQAAATSALLTDGRFVLGVGTGEALNEHVHGDRWPPADVRRRMLEEAVAVIRELLSGRTVDHHGPHYTVENARLYTAPDTPPPIYVSGFGPASAELAGRIGDGFICTMPSTELRTAFESAGGAGKPSQGGVKVCWGLDQDDAVATAHRIWPNDLLPGQLAQDLPTPTHFEQASTMVTPDQVRDAVVCGPDVDAHVAAVQSFVDAGYAEVYVSQIGPDADDFFDAYGKRVLPALRGDTSA